MSNAKKKNALSPADRASIFAAMKPVLLTLEGTPLTGAPKEFSTGSLGWYCSGKATVLVDGKPVQVQVGCNITVIGSKTGDAGE